MRGWSFGVRGSPQNTYLVIVEAREVPPTAEIARFGRYTACWRESELSQPRPFPVPPLPQFGSPVRGQSRALMRVLNCLDCTAGYPVHHEGAAHGVADCDSAAMFARSSLCQFTVSFRLRSLRRGDKCAQPAVSNSVKPTASLSGPSTTSLTSLRFVRYFWAESKIFLVIEGASRDHDD